MNKIEIKKQIENTIKQRFDSANIQARQYQDYAYTIAEFANIDKQCRSLKLDVAKLQFENKDFREIEEALKKCEAERKSIAQKHNLDLEKFVPEFYYECKKCNDKGFIKGEKCICYKKLFSKLMLEQNNLISVLPSLKDFDSHLFDDKNVGDKLKAMCQKYILDFPSVPVVLVLQGSVGVGKTFATQAIINELINKNIIVSYFSAFEFAKILKDWHFSDMLQKANYEQLFLDCDLLVIDDLGTEPIYQNINYEYMQNIFDKRNINKLPTIIVTNLESNEFLNLYGERLYSRVFFDKNSKVINIQNTDIRKKLHNKK